VAFDSTTIFRRTSKGVEEIRDRRNGLEQRYRRALIMVDGTRDITELSVMMRPGEIEGSLEKLIEGGYVEAVPKSEQPANRIVYVIAANDPAHFGLLKVQFIGECGARLGPFAETVIEEIRACETALELRGKLRDIEDIMAAAMTPPEAAAFAHTMGEELTRLVPR
jgi:hypothetical protein